MRLQSLKINNIRSVANLDIELPESSILFYGDIGCGKSSVLKAVEFALFGTLTSGNLSGKSILRRGENKGSVELTFTIDDKAYTIYRELKKVTRKDTKTKEEKEKIQPSESWLIEDDVKTSYATRDLRRKILSILNYSIPRYESKNNIDIYRYTVYTPQEEIKAILQTDPEDRFEILKDVLEIEKYENTLSNLVKVKKQLNLELRDIERDIKAIGTPEDIIPQKKQEIEEQKSKIKSKIKDIATKNKILTDAKKKQSSIQEEFNNYAKKSTEIKSKSDLIKSNSTTILGNEKKVTGLKTEIIGKQREFDELPTIDLKTDKPEEELEQLIEKNRTFIQQKSNKKGSISNQLENIDKLLKEGKCSLCGRPIHDKKQFNDELKETQKQFENISKEINALAEEIENFESWLKDLREYNKNEEKKRSIQDIIKEKLSRESDLTKGNEDLKKIVDITEKEIEKILKSYKIESLEKFHQLEAEIKNKIDGQNESVENIQSEVTTLEKDLSTFETELNTMQKELESLKEEVERKKMLKELKEYMGTIKDWVSDQLPVLLKDIERTILATTASQFDQYFKEWFGDLVEEENISIEINPENFQPIVMMNGYESPFGDLSGGEKSALSLAYRLALNKIINTKHSEIKSKGLLILDEPTDGFSEQQVNKMQTVFDKLDTPQIIIISHERTLDSFVTDIFNFKKVNHKTSVKKEIVK